MFSGTIQKTGRINLPREIVSGAVEIVLRCLSARYVTRRLIDVNGSYVIIPKPLRGLIDLPYLGAFEVLSAPGLGEPSLLLPMADECRFLATVRAHKKGSRSLHLPMDWARGLLRAGWGEGVCATIGPVEFVGILRRDQQGIVTLGVPQTVPLAALPVILRRPAPIEDAGQIFDGDTLDWAAVPFDGIRITDGDHLVLPTQRSALSIRRRVPVVEVAWLLGFYLAEGARTQQAVSLGQKSRVNLRLAEKGLLALGVSPHELSLGVLYGRTSSAQAIAYYRSIGLERSWARRSSAQGSKEHDHSAELSVKGSSTLVRLLVGLLDHIVEAGHTILPPAALTPFLMGFLAGDGSIVDAGTPRLSTHCSTKKEADLVDALLVSWLGRGGGHREVKTHHAVIRSVSAFDAVKLLVAGAFPGSLSRPKLFYIAHEVLDHLKGQGLKRWGYLDEHGNPTPAAEEARRQLATLDREWAYVQTTFALRSEASIGVKGGLYEFPEGWQPVGNGWSTIRRKQREGSPDVHHPEEKVAQIREVLVGLSDLRIYEAHAGTGSCTRAYRDHGEVISRVISDGDDVQLLYAEAARQAKYDIVDLDPYGFPFKMLLAGVFQLLSAGGYLFLTCPDPRKIFGGASKRIQMAYFGGEVFSREDVIGFVERMALVAGLSASVCSALDLGSVWRLAFKLRNVS